MAQIHLSNLETHSYRADMVSGRYSGPGQAEESNNPDPLPAEELQRNNACTEVEDLSSNGSWPQTSISRSLQRAEALLRTTFNPSFKWLLRKCSQEDEEEEEGSFVATHNLVSRSSARLLRLQQGMLNISPQRLLVRESEVLLQVCVKGTSQEGCIVQQQQPSLQGCYRALWSLLEQRSQLLFVHEYGRRVRSAVAYMSRLTALLEGELRRPDLMLKQNPFTSFSFKVVPLSQELCVHLNHWSCLSSKARSDAFLRPALARQTYMLVQMRRTLGSLGLQALLLMENCVYAILSALAQTHIESIPRETLEDILTATELYNQMFEEHKSLHSATQWKNGALQRKCYSRLPVLQSARSSQPSTFQVKELLKVVAVYHGNMAAIELHHWASSGNNQIQPNHQVLPRPEARLQSQQSVRTGWTWERLEHTYYPLGSHDTHSAPSLFLPPLLHPVQLCNPSTDRPGSSGRGSVHDRPGSSGRGSVHDRPGSSERGSVPNSSQTPGHSSAVPLKAFCQQDQSSLELLFQAMMSSSELLAPLVPHTPTPELLASTPELPVLVTRTEVIGTNVQTDVVVSQGGRADGKPAPPKRQRTEQLQHKCFKKGYQDQMEPAASCPSSGDRCPGDDPVKERGEGQEFLLRPRSVKWLDLGHSSVCTDLFGEYRATLWSICSQALWQYFHFPPDGAVGSINLWSDHEKFQLLHTFRQASMADLVPKECRAMLEKFCLRLLVGTAHTHWDHVLCCSLGSGLKDKCLPGSSRERRLLMTSPERDGSPVITATVKLLLRLSPPLLSSIRSHHLADSIKTGPSSQALCRTTASLALGSVQASMIWVMSKAYQFLSSWSLDRFLLITQGDLQALRVSLERLLQHMETLMADGSDVVSHHHHHHVLLSQHVGVLRRAVSQLQDFSSVVLKIFSSGCKQMSGKIFEQTMPSAKHWRLNYNTEFPSSPSEYASMAAQTVIGQVLEGVAPLSDDARVQALSVTMTAFMEAWMEHILKQKIKFSVQGALQLKQDFNLIRELIQSDQYSLSDDLHQRLLNLRVFQQVDSAVVCLLQQPQAKPYLQSSGWEPFRRCCPTMSSRSSVDVAIGGSITNLENMEGEVLTLTPDAPQAPPTSPGQTYMAPSLALGAAQQEWLDLRIHNSAPRWRLPGLQCLFKSEP